MLPFRLFRPDPVAAAAERLRFAALAQARRPAFFLAWGMPDSLDGRFETLCLHVFLVLRRLQAEGATARPLAQALLDATVADLDRMLRELGVGDLGVARRIRAMGEGLMGRIAAYDAALGAADEAALGAALRRNLWGTLRTPAEPAPAALAAACRYLREATAALAGQSLDSLRDDGPSFPPIPDAGP